MAAVRLLHLFEPKSSFTFKISNFSHLYIGINVFTLERSPKVGFTRSPWAIKKRNKDVTDDPKYNTRIKLEAEILRKLKHPNIVQFKALAVSNGEPCLVMEKLDISLGYF